MDLQRERELPSRSLCVAVTRGPFGSRFGLETPPSREPARYVPGATCGPTSWFSNASHVPPSPSIFAASG